ncbi:hypothetical protein JMJ77_0006799 [Colletotrichum scovillei]|uniref:Uncharacterized protein n=1 Tax=Colletotrichum scovillei TaxID=1209932 RepID=A0A9P7RJ94_9PEZI|nr:hypothetical protein JMJ77_0006799 [Colletotrichum scovillei]KAG7078048.1 hypothetical protein JMJ76_0015285 [Colletotrichum scovillei]KAG7085205.1 hypothetical protein JMJ78_0010630 [Colletotrichum scovillei]
MAITRSSNSSAIPPSQDVPFPESVAAHHPGAQTSVVLRPIFRDNLVLRLTTNKPLWIDDTPPWLR